MMKPHALNPMKLCKFRGGNNSKNSKNNENSINSNNNSSNTSIDSNISNSMFQGGLHDKDSGRSLPKAA